MKRDSSQRDVRSRIRNFVILGLKNLGLTESFLLRASRMARCPLPTTSLGHIDYGEMPVSQWVWLCRFLYLPLDPSSGQWLTNIQQYHAGQAIMEGRFTLPRTAKVTKLLKGYLERERSDIRFQKESYGDPLLTRMMAERRSKVKERRTLRRRNLKRYTSLRRQCAAVALLARGQRVGRASNRSISAIKAKSSQLGPHPTH